METTPRPQASPGTRRRPARAAKQSFPVTVTQLPLARCQICSRTLAHRPGEVNAVLTAHYEREHGDLLTR